LFHVAFLLYDKQRANCFNEVSMITSFDQRPSLTWGHFHVKLG